MSRPTGERGRVDAGRKTGHVGDNPWYVVHFLGAETAATLPTHQAGPVLIRICLYWSSRQITGHANNPSHHTPSPQLYGQRPRHNTQYCMWALGSVANSVKNFLASPEEKFGRWGKNFGPPVIITFWQFDPFRSNRPKFCRLFVLHAQLFSALFDLCSRKFSQVDNTAAYLVSWLRKWS